MKCATTLITIFVVLVYVVVGGVVFHFLEKDHEAAVRDDVSAKLAEFLAANPCVTEEDLVQAKHLQEHMFVGGLRFDPEGVIMNASRWDFETSIFVGIQLVATVGYSRAAPKTTGGRIFAICFAFIGIPAFLLAVIGFGKLLNLAAETLIRLLSRCCRSEDPYWPLDGRPPPRMPKSARQKFQRRRAVYRTVGIAVVGAGLFVFVPSAIFMQLEDWTYWEAAYYCAITLFTIGFGDFVPGYQQEPSAVSSGWYRLAVGCWIVIVIGWSAGVVSSFRAAIYAFAHKAESRIILVANGIFYTPQQEPDVFVSQTGKKSVVNILPPDNVRDALRMSGTRPHRSTVDDVTARPRTGPPTNFGHDIRNTHVFTSNVKVS